MPLPSVEHARRLGGAWAALAHHGRETNSNLGAFLAPHMIDRAKSNCMYNDHPTVVALHVLLERVLQLPPSVVTAAQQERWTAMQNILPPVPVMEENGFVTVSPCVVARTPLARMPHACRMPCGSTVLKAMSREPPPPSVGTAPRTRSPAL